MPVTVFGARDAKAVEATVKIASAQVKSALSAGGAERARGKP